MRKIIKHFTILTILIIIVSQFYSYSVTVSDNDGSAFITKAEFDNLKNAFQNELDSYNTSIDSKIDTAIASYLAGIITTKSEDKKCNINEFEFPLMIYDHNTKIKNIQRADTTDSLKENSLWAPALNIFIYLTNRYSTSCGKMTRDQIDNVKNWFWGYKLSEDYFMLKGTSKDMKATFVSTYLADNYLATVDSDQYPSGFALLDQSSQVTSWNTGAGSTNSRNTHANFAVLATSNADFGYLTDAFFAHKCSYAQVKSNISWVGSTANGGACDKVKVTSYECFGSTAHTCTAYNGFNSWEHSETTSDKINLLYNNANTSGIYAPVTYSDDYYDTKCYVRYTNKKANRYIVDKSSDTSRVQRWAGMSGSNPFGRTIQTAGYGIGGVLTLGENLEDESEDTSRKWYNKSLIKPERILYDFSNDKVTKTYHRVAEGVPIYIFTDFPSDKYSDVVKVRINISSGDYSTAAQLANAHLSICFSNKPITITDYTANIDSNTDYYYITDYDGTKYTGKRKIELNKNYIASGSGNEITIKGVKNNDVLYAKLLWAPQYPETGTATYDYQSFNIVSAPYVVTTKTY